MSLQLIIATIMSWNFSSLHIFRVVYRVLFSVCEKCWKQSVKYWRAITEQLDTFNSMETSKSWRTECLPVSLLFSPHLFHFGQQIVNLGAFPVHAHKEQQLNIQPSPTCRELTIQWQVRAKIISYWDSVHSYSLNITHYNSAVNGQTLVMICH